MPDVGNCCQKWGIQKKDKKGLGRRGLGVVFLGVSIGGEEFKPSAQYDLSLEYHTLTSLLGAEKSKCKMLSCWIVGRSKSL